jgi:Transposase
MLRDHEIEVLEVNRPDRAMRRSKGKSDPTDAENAARVVLSGRATAIPKEQSGAAEAMRAVSVARRSAVKAKTQAINQLRALLVSAPQDIRDRLLKAKTAECVESCARVRSLGKTLMLQTLTATLRLLAKRWLMLAEELNPVSRPLDQRTKSGRAGCIKSTCWKTKYRGNLRCTTATIRLTRYHEVKGKLSSTRRPRVDADRKVPENPSKNDLAKKLN